MNVLIEVSCYVVAGFVISVSVIGGFVAIRRQFGKYRSHRAAASRVSNLKSGWHLTSSGEALAVHLGRTAITAEQYLDHFDPSLNNSGREPLAGRYPPPLASSKARLIVPHRDEEPPPVV